MKRFFRGVMLLVLGLYAFLFVLGCQASRTLLQDSATEQDSEGEAEAATSNESSLQEAAGKTVRSEASQTRGNGSTTDLDQGALLEIWSKHDWHLHETEEGDDHWMLAIDGYQVAFKEASRIAKLNDVSIFLDRPFESESGVKSLSRSDLRLLSYLLFGSAREVKPHSTIVIDPGHGGSENGAQNEELQLAEKDLTLDVSERLKEHLEGLGYKIVMTRYDDRTVSLEERPSIASRLKAGVFVSIHFNAATNPDAQGLETFVLSAAGEPSTSATVAGDDAIAYPGNEFDLESFELAFRIQENLVSRMQRNDRGLKKARWRVLKTLECPGVLVECGFISHAEEALLISTPAYREKLARALAAAIDEYAQATNG